MFSLYIIYYLKYCHWYWVIQFVMQEFPLIFGCSQEEDKQWLLQIVDYIEHVKQVIFESFESGDLKDNSI